jgi:excisionase family DNA binding protein
MGSAGFVPADDSPVRRATRSVLVDQAAELLGVSRRTVYNRIREGRLQTIRTRCGSQRVLLESVESLLREMVRVEKSRTRGRDAGV